MHFLFMKLTTKWGREAELWKLSRQNQNIKTTIIWTDESQRERFSKWKFSSELKATANYNEANIQRVEQTETMTMMKYTIIGINGFDVKIKRNDPLKRANVCQSCEKAEVIFLAISNRKANGLRLEVNWFDQN